MCLMIVLMILRIKSDTINPAITTRTEYPSKPVRCRNSLRSAKNNPDMNCTYVKNRPLEFVDVGYKRNVYFSVRTIPSYYQERLSTQILTWFQTVHHDDVGDTSVINIPLVIVMLVFELKLGLLGAVWLQYMLT